jgi:Tol biopolymer transport system component
LAALNHPNIAAIYGVEDRALVMELVDGPTLAERIAQGPIPLADALEIARQIADALEAAHEKGIVHRDLKPANIKVTPDGRVKVLDFGLAKAMVGEPISGDPVNSPTLTMKATVAGIIVGTAGYMAPEQAKGKPVDKRADIWAFGVVLWEMLTGQTLYTGETISDTLAAVLTREPDLERVPPQVHKLMRSCLEKEPKKRLRDIADAWRLIEEPSAAPPAPAAGKARSPLPWMIAAGIVTVAAALALVHFREIPAPAPLMRFIVPPPEKQTFSAWMALSPDGRHLAFTAYGSDAVSRVWLRSLDSLELRALGGTEVSTIATMFWSPDSRYVVFQTPGKVKKIDITGGPPQSLCDEPSTMLGGSWSAGGVVLYGSNSSSIRRISSTGGPPSLVTRVEASRGENYHSDPIFLPDGVHFLYFRHSSKPEVQGVYVGSLDVKPEAQSLRRIQPVDFSPGYAPPLAGGSHGYLVLLRDGNLLAQPFDERRMETTGEGVPIAEQVGSSITRALFSVSANGVLAFRAGGAASSQLTWFDRQGQVLGQAGAPDDYQDPSISPDGTHLAYIRPTQGSVREIWILDIAHSIHTRLTFVPDGARGPQWSPDGRRIAFSSSSGPEVYIQDVANAGAAEQVFQAGAANTITDWSPDGRYLVSTLTAHTFDVMALPLATGGDRKLLPIADSQSAEMHGRVSPDSRWIAYDSTESGRTEVYVRPFPPGDGRTGKWMVSPNGGQQARWRGDGGELIYLAPDRNLMAVDVKTQPVFQSGTPHALFPIPVQVGQNLMSIYDATRDGKRFVFITPSQAAATSPATIVVNWEQAIRR